MIIHSEGIRRRKRNNTQYTKHARKRLLTYHGPRVVISGEGGTIAISSMFNATSLKLEQSLNAPSPILVTVEGMVTLTSEEQHLNAFLLIFVIPS